MRIPLENYKNKLHNENEDIETVFNNKELTFKVTIDSETKVYMVELSLGCFYVNL